MQTKTAQLNARIMEQIAQCYLRPGDQLPSERELAAQYGVSRTTVHQVLNQLQRGGLIQRQPGKRAVVINQFREIFSQATSAIPLTPDGISQIFQLRAQLEGEAAYFCAQRATDSELALIDAEYQLMVQRNQGESTLSKARADLRFHTLIAEYSHNLAVVSFSQIFYERFFNAIYSVLDQTLKRHGRYPQGIRGQHAAIHQAITRRDAELARAQAIEHIQFTESLYRS